MSTSHAAMFPRRLARAAVVTAVVLAATGSSAAHAQGDGVDVVNTETVQVYLDPTGEVDSRRVYEQLTMTGEGSIDIANPVEERAVRNLDGFAGVDAEDGVQELSVRVAGVERRRTVSTYTGDLPLEVSVAYRLDGKRVAPEELLGAEGEVEVRYTVENVTGEQTEVSYPDGQGGTITENAEVPVPMVGSLTTTTPATFTDVRSDEANMAGDGRGGTRLSFTMTLFPPIGSDAVSFGYTAQVTDGVVPDASISALPVDPLASPTFRTAGESYESGAATGTRLAQGATTIDENLLRLRDGAAELLAGLVRLRDGADELRAGLADRAAPGARRIADGAHRLDEGLGKIDDGAGRLYAGSDRLRDGAGRIDDGAGRLATGAQRAADGSRKLEDGLARISRGLDKLAGTEGLRKATAGIEALRDGVERIRAGFGQVGADGTLLDGLNQLEHGMLALEDGAGRLAGGLGELRGDGTEATPGLVAARAGVDQVQAGLQDAVRDGGSLDRLIEGLTLVMGTDCGPICDGIISEKILPPVEQSKVDLGTANQGLVQISAGLGKALGALDTQLVPGARKLADGAALAHDGARRAEAGAVRLRDGVVDVDDGLARLQRGMADAVAGALRLAAGAGAAHQGSGALVDGLVRIDGGAGELASGADRLATGAGALAGGAGRLADGAGKARDGSRQLADGAGELAGGLADAADGSGRLADGLDRAAAGAPRIVDGAGRLSEEGMSQLIGAGEDTAQEYGKLYAVVTAGAERARTEGMAYGAPRGARGLTAYSFELMGNDGEGGRNLQRGLLATVLLVLGLGGAAVRRRFV